MAMRPPVGLPTMSKRAKRVLIALVGLAVLGILWFQFVGIYVDWLWFGEVGFREVFTTQALSRAALFLIAGLGSGGLVFGALYMAYKSRPVFVPTNEVDPLSPYRTIVTTRPKLFAFGISGLIALICGLSAQSDWATVQLFLNGGPFGTVDPQFGNDVGFYVFTLPMIQLVLGWLFVIIAICFIAVAVVQYLFGGIRLSGPGRKITSQATLQLSLLVAAFVLLKAVQYWYDRYELLFSNRGGTFTGASYTDVNAVLPAKLILMLIAAICAIGFIVGAFTRSIKLPAIALGLLVLSSVLIGGVWPLVLQQVVVNPNGINREPEYIAKNIAATRTAYDLQDVKYEDYPGVLAGDPRDIINDEDTLPNARLLDPNVLAPTFTQQQQLRNFYGFPDQLAMDRYTVDGQTQDYVVAVRELNADGLNDAQKNWINEHMVFTHGDGFVAAPANTVADGYPDYSVSDIANIGNPNSDIPVAQPRTYYGQLTTDYAIVGAEGGAAREYDTETSRYTYTGAGGVDVGNLFQRAVFATEYGEANFLFSSEINSNSKILYNRDPIERVKKAAPFVTTDTKAYPAVVDGRIVWIVDAYTTATNYPYAQAVTLSDATNNSLAASGAAGQVNQQVSYIRNSVKATVDAYDGTVTLYAVDEADPVLKAWEGVFPGLVKPGSDVSPESARAFPVPAGPVRGAAIAAGALPRKRPGRLLPELRLLAGAERPDGQRCRAGAAAAVLPAGQAARRGRSGVPTDQRAHRLPARVHERLRGGLVRSRQLRPTHRAATTHVHANTRPDTGATAVPNDAGGEQPRHVVHPAGRCPSDLRQPAHPAGQRRPVVRRAVLHPGAGVADVLPAAEPGAGLVRRPGRGRGDPGAGIDPGSSQRPGRSAGR